MIKDEIAIGSVAPEFRLPATMGGRFPLRPAGSGDHVDYAQREVGLADYRGKKVVLFFVREYN
jgi:peroxiredoxin